MEYLLKTGKCALRFEGFLSLGVYHFPSNAFILILHYFSPYLFPEPVSRSCVLHLSHLQSWVSSRYISSPSLFSFSVPNTLILLARILQILRSILFHDQCLHQLVDTTFLFSLPQQAS